MRSHSTERIFNLEEHTSKITVRIVLPTEEQYEDKTTTKLPIAEDADE